MTKTSLISNAASGAAALWNGAARLRVRLYRSGLLRQERLAAKVISVGNIAWGGTGKTPFTIWLARRLQDGRLRVSILTRGYRRASRDRVQLILPGTLPENAADAGDEAQLFLRNLRSLRIPVGVSSSRYEAGKLLESQFPVDVHLLDDGFQHLALHRDLDLVLVDAENPWGGRGPFRSLLRESRAALRRADAILLTRCELLPSVSGEDSLESLRAAIQRFSPSAPCFTARTQLLRLVEWQGNHALEPEEFRTRRPLAFGALGNPSAFFQMLAREGISTSGQKTFPDHYRYSMSDLGSLEKAAGEAGADCLLTTEKDLTNLPANAHLRLPLYWAAIELSVEEEPRLLQWIWDRLELPGAPPELQPEEARNSQAQFATEGRPGRRGFDRLTTE